MKNLNDLLKRLLDHKVDFVLIGGFAGVVHGSTQVTQDLDICAVLSEDQIAKLRSALKDLSPIHQGGVLDVIQEVIGVGDFETLSENADEFEIFGKRCKVMSLDDLIKVKQSLNRDKDKAILNELLALKKSKS